MGEDSFPIILAGTGIVGTITVSGLSPQDDHKLAVESIRNFLAQEK